MKQSNTKNMKRNFILRIVIFIIGGVLVVTGTFFAVASILPLQAEGIFSDLISLIIVSVITLTAGVCICILAIKMPIYLAEANKISREQRLIENHKRYLRQRKNTVLIALMLAYILFCLLSFFWQIKELDAKLTTEKITSIASFEELNLELPFLFSHFYALAGSKAKLIILQYTCVALAIIVTMFLLIEISGIYRDKLRLTVSMWEKIQQLEDEVRELKAGTQADGQQISDVDGGDSTSGTE